MRTRSAVPRGSRSPGEQADWDLTREIRSRRRLSAAILNGSFACGGFHAGSGVDLIVVGDFRERHH